MHRSYSADQVITLPRLDVTAAIALGQQLVSAARAEDQPSSRIARALERLSAARGALTLVALPTPRSSAGAEARRQTHRLVDGAWGALFDWLSGWSKLPYEPAVAAQARRISGALYPNGLKFTLLPFKLEWAESETRLSLLDRGGFGDTIAELGGAPFLEAIRKAHQAYGEVLGITQVPCEAPPPPAVREPLEAFLLALRGYVLQVTAHADDEDPGSQALAERLLGPLERWQTPAKSKARLDDPANGGSTDDTASEPSGDEAPPDDPREDS